MLPECVPIKKSLQQRAEELDFLFNSSETCYYIHKVWAHDLESEFGNNYSNLQCLWQMSEESCTMYHTLYPTTVVVKIINVVFLALSATITVEGVQEDLTFPENVFVPLIELYPTKEQIAGIPFEVAQNISDCLDRCRFFYLYIWYPWDTDGDSLVCDWAQSHLQNRLRLQFDIRDGKFNSFTRHYIENLLTEAVEVNGLLENEEDNYPDDDKKKSIIANIIRKKRIKMELGFFETPDLKNAMVKYVTEKEMSKVCQNMLLLAHGTFNDMYTFINNANSCLKGDTKTEITNCPTNAVATIPSGSLLVLSEGTHIFPNLGNLSFGGQIIGVTPDSANTVIMPKPMLPKKYIFLNCFDSVTFENLTIERNEGALLCSTQGTLRLKSCTIRGTQGCGVLIQTGCRLEMVNCTLSNLTTGILAKRNSYVLLESTLLSHCSEGIKVVEDASVTLLKVTISCSTVAAIVAQSSKVKCITGEEDILNDFPDIQVNDTIFQGNKTNALIECSM